MHLLQHFKNLTLHPKNARELKGLILQLAIQGKLTANWRNEKTDLEPASELLKKIDKEKAQLIKEKKIKKEKSLPKITKDEIIENLPSNWESVRLGEMGDWGAGSTPLRSNSLFYDGEINWFKSGELNNGIIDYESKEKITELAIKKSSLRLNKIGDVLIAMYGATIGKTAILNIEGTTNQAVCACTPFSCISNTYLHLLLKGLKDVFINQGEGGAQPNISRVKIRNQVFGLPPFEEQKEIVCVVEILFKEVEQLEQLTKERIALKEDFVTSALRQLTTKNASTEWDYLQNHFKSFFTEKSAVKKLREAVLQLAVQGKLTVDWRKNNPETEPATELLKRILKEKVQLIKDKKIKKESPLPPISIDEIPYELPESWVWCRVGDLTTIKGGKRIPKGYELSDEKTEHVYIRVTDMKNGTVISSKLKYITDDIFEIIKSYTISKDDLYITIAGTIGDVGEIPEELDNMNLTENAAKLIIYKSDKLFLKTLLRSSLCQTQFIGKVNQMAQPKLALHRIASTFIPLPPLEEQKAIVEKVNALMLLCDELEQEIEDSKNLNEQLMESVLREVFKGEEI